MPKAICEVKGQILPAGFVLEGAAAGTGLLRSVLLWGSCRPAGLGSAPSGNQTRNKTSVRASGHNSETVLNPKKCQIRNPELTLLSLGNGLDRKQKVAGTPKSEAVMWILCSSEQIPIDLQST